MKVELQPASGNSENLDMPGLRTMRTWGAICGWIAFILFGVIPLLVFGLIIHPLFTCALVIGITLVVGAMRLNQSRLRVDVLNRAIIDSAVPANSSNTIVLKNNAVIANTTVPVRIGVVPVNNPNADGGAGDGAAEAGALVPRPPDGRPPTLKAEAALPIPPFNLRAVSLSIRRQTPRQA